MDQNGGDDKLFPRSILNMKVPCIFAGVGNLSERCGEAVSSALVHAGGAILLCLDGATAVLGGSCASFHAQLGIRTH